VGVMLLIGAVVYVGELMFNREALDAEPGEQQLEEPVLERSSP
jgi:hypothetical protein